jgi:hypothetical protein
MWYVPTSEIACRMRYIAAQQGGAVRRKAQFLATWLPERVLVMQLTMVFTLVYVSLSEDWMPAYYLNAVRYWQGETGAASSCAFWSFLMTALGLYVLSAAGAGLATAQLLCAALRRIVRLD